MGAFFFPAVVLKNNNSLYVNCIFNTSNTFNNEKCHRCQDVIWAKRLGGGKGTGGKRTGGKSKTRGRVLEEDCLLLCCAHEMSRSTKLINVPQKPPQHL